MAHKLNLVIVASCMTTRHVATFFDNLQSLYVFFSFWPASPQSSVNGTRGIRCIVERPAGITFVSMLT